LSKNNTHSSARTDVVTRQYSWQDHYTAACLNTHQPQDTSSLPALSVRRHLIPWVVIPLSTNYLLTNLPPGSGSTASQPGLPMLLLLQGRGQCILPASAWCRCTSTGLRQPMSQNTLPSKRMSGNCPQSLLK
jgi:hypothetical protein